MNENFQLELNLEDRNPDEMKLYHLQKQIDAMNESMGKVRRKMFAELNEAKKLMAAISLENEYLKKTINELKNEKQEWAYAEDNYLFKIAG